MNYLRLSRLAINIFSVPLILDELERVFSSTRRTISWERNRLRPELVEMSELLGNWLRNGQIREAYIVSE
jgi:hypothetical protein